MTLDHTIPALRNGEGQQHEGTVVTGISPPMSFPNYILAVKSNHLHFIVVMQTEIYVHSLASFALVARVHTGVNPNGKLYLSDVSVECVLLFVAHSTTCLCLLSARIDCIGCVL